MQFLAFGQRQDGRSLAVSDCREPQHPVRGIWSVASQSWVTHSWVTWHCPATCPKRNQGLWRLCDLCHLRRLRPNCLVCFHGEVLSRHICQICQMQPVRQSGPKQLTSSCLDVGPVTFLQLVPWAFSNWSSELSPIGPVSFLQLIQWAFSNWSSNLSPTDAVSFLQLVPWSFSKWSRDLSPIGPVSFLQPVPWAFSDWSRELSPTGPVSCLQLVP